MYIFPEQLLLHSTSELYINYKMEYSLSTRHDLLSKSPEWQTGKSSYAVYILYCYIKKKKIEEGIFLVLHIFLGVWFGVCQHQ